MKFYRKKTPQSLSNKHWYSFYFTFTVYYLKKNNRPRYQVETRNEIYYGDFFLINQIGPTLRLKKKRNKYFVCIIPL